jgi:hypothetical protein
MIKKKKNDRRRFHRKHGAHGKGLPIEGNHKIHQILKKALRAALPA